MLSFTKACFGHELRSSLLWPLTYYVPVMTSVFPTQYRVRVLCLPFAIGRSWQNDCLVPPLRDANSAVKNIAEPGFSVAGGVVVIVL